MRAPSPLPPSRPSSLLHTRAGRQPLPQGERGWGPAPPPALTRRGAHRQPQEPERSSPAPTRTPSTAGLPRLPRRGPPGAQTGRGFAEPPTQVPSPGNIQLRSVGQWESARGRRSKVNGRRCLRRRGRGRQGLAGGPAFRACALGAGALREARRRSAGGAWGMGRFREPRSPHAPWPREKWGQAAADNSCRNDS